MVPEVKPAIFTGTSIDNVAVDFDITPPAFMALSPTDGTTSFSASGNLTLTFNEEVKKSVATGTAAELHFVSTKPLAMYWWKPLTAPSANVTISGGVVTINPTTILDYNTDYYVLAGNKTISDFTDNNWIGITLSYCMEF